jgi:hypothetical protein
VEASGYALRGPFRALRGAQLVAGRLRPVYANAGKTPFLIQKIPAF